jgi:8-oxo-dGTP pyrophosphatase MutT (NUDIX family)
VAAASPPTPDVTDPSPPEHRDGARVVLVDPTGSVLLINERIEDGTHWLTPGGGVEPGESLALAAVREVYEETSLRVQLDPHAEPVHVVDRVWHWRGRSYHQVDHFFVVHLPDRPEVSPAAPTAMETETLLGFGWWSVADLRALDGEVIEPPDLADLLERLSRRPA